MMGLMLMRADRLVLEPNFTRLPCAVLVAGIGYLVAAWSAVVLVDVLGSRPLVPLWARIFQEHGLTERVQWALLLIGIIACVRLSLRQDPHTRRFLMLMAIGLTLMLYEDVLNISHHMGAVLGPSPTGVRVGRLLVYAALAAFLVLALATHWSRLSVGRGYLLTGYTLYALAAGASVPANLLGFYERLGAWLMERTAGGLLRPLPDGLVRMPEYDVADLTGIVFLDFVIEESVELLGATTLVAGLLVVGLRGYGPRPSLPEDRPAGDT